jgi:hypothetical protein
VSVETPRVRPVRRWWPVVPVAAVLLGAGMLLVNRCADGGAMASRYQTCDCRGIEWVRYDRTAADGPRRTICLGLAASTTCHRSRSGEVVSCH